MLRLTARLLTTARDRRRRAVERGMLRAVSLSLVIAALGGFASPACSPPDEPMDECRDLDTLEPAECVDVLGEVAGDGTAHFNLCCNGVQRRGPPGAVCDALLVSSFDECTVIDCLRTEDACEPAGACRDLYDHLHGNTAGCDPPAPCIDTGALVYCPDILFEGKLVPGDEFKCSDAGLCVLK